MSRVRAVESKIAWGIDDSGAEDELPEAVGHHPGGEWILLRRDPLGDLDATLLLGLVNSHLEGTHHLKGIRRHFFALRHGVAAVETVGFSGLGKISDPSLLTSFEGGDARVLVQDRRHQATGCLCLGGVQFCKKGIGVRLSSKGMAVGGSGEGLPGLFVQRSLDEIIGRESVGIDAITVTGPLDSLDGLGSLELQLHPTALFVTDPAVLVSD